MKKTSLLLAALLVALLLSACGRSANVSAEEVDEPETEDAQSQPSDAQTGALPEVPERLRFVDGAPQLSVYIADEETVEDMNLEQYVMGVLAGEMRNDWPMEALKAQAVLARTFVMKFLTEKESSYGGADISTDIREAQAYDAGSVNSRIEKAVMDTAGQVLSYDGEFPYAWFHAHAGGQTDYPTLALDYENEDPPYIASVASRDSDKAPTTVKNWKASFTADEVVKAAREAGASVTKLSSIAVGEKSDAGRAVTLLINGQEISAAKFRVALGSTLMKSTMLTGLTYENGRVTIQGRGYGHGVGMSQWGAYGMAEEGAGYEEIVTYYFKDVSLVQLWP